MKRTRAQDVESPRLLRLVLLLALGGAIWGLGSRWSEPFEWARLELVSHDPGAGETAAPRLTVRALPPPPEPELRLIRGRVVDPAGRPIVGAAITLGTEATVCTGRHGDFALPESRLAVRVEAPGHFPLEVPELLAAAREAAASEEDGIDAAPEVTWTLYPGCQLEGEVLDDRGRPVPGVRVAVGADLDGGFDVVRTDRRGRWRSPLRPSGAAHVLYRHPDHLPLDETVVLAAPGDRVERRVRLESGRPVAITVRAADGRPLADTELWHSARLGASRAAPTSLWLGRTGDLGELRVHVPIGVDPHIRARLAGWRSTDVSLPPAREDRRTSLHIVLEPSIALTAHAIDARTGLPVDVTSVRLEGLDGLDFRPVPDRGVLFHSLARGRILIGLPPSAAVLRVAVRGAGRLAGTSEEIVFDGLTAPAEVEVRLEPDPMLRGIVLHRGEPLDGVPVRLLRQREATPWDEPGEARSFEAVDLARSGADGRFELRMRPGEPLRLEVSAPGFAPWRSEALRLPLPPGAGEEFPIVLQRGSRLAGVVRDGAGSPVPDVPVLLSVDGSSPTWTTWTDAAGGYAFDGLAALPSVRVAVGDPDSTPGLYDIGLTGSAPTAVSVPSTAREVSVPPDSTVALDLSANGPFAGRIEGRVTLDDAPTAARVRVVPLDRPGLGVDIDAGDDGSFRLTRVPPGRYSVVAPAARAMREVEVGSAATVRAELAARSVRYELLVLSDLHPDRLLEGPCIAALTPLDAPGSERRASSEAGRLVFEGLLPGAYRLRLRASEHLPFETTVRIDADRAERVVLEFGAATEIQLLAGPDEPYRGEVEWTLRRDGRVIGRERTRVDGLLRLPMLARGDYDLTVETSRGVMRRTLRIGAR